MDSLHSLPQLHQSNQTILPTATIPRVLVAELGVLPPPSSIPVVSRQEFFSSPYASFSSGPLIWLFEDVFCLCSISTLSVIVLDDSFLSASEVPGVGLIVLHLTLHLLASP